MARVLRRLVGAYPYRWLDAPYVKARQDGRVSSMAVVIAVGVTATGEREVLGFDAGPSEAGACWLGFLRGLVARGLTGVHLVISDAHLGLTAALAAVLLGASWQRCRVHFVRNALALVPKSAQQLVATTIRTVFAQPDAENTGAQWDRVAESLRPRLPRRAALLDEAKEDVLAYLAFPREHWRQSWSNHPLERLNREVKRRTDMVGSFPNDGAGIRLVGAVLAEQHDEWQVGRRYLSAESLAKLVTPPERVEEVPVGLLLDRALPADQELLDSNAWMAVNLETGLVAAARFGTKLLSAKYATQRGDEAKRMEARSDLVASMTYQETPPAEKALLEQEGRVHAQAAKKSACDVGDLNLAALAEWYDAVLERKLADFESDLAVARQYYQRADSRLNKLADPKGATPSPWLRAFARQEQIKVRMGLVKRLPIGTHAEQGFSESIFQELAKRA